MQKKMLLGEAMLKQSAYKSVLTDQIAKIDKLLSIVGFLVVCATIPLMDLIGGKLVSMISAIMMSILILVCRKSHLLMRGKPLERRH
jgi:hypothetical protein